MRVIHDDLPRNVVRATGGYVDRLEIAAGYAADASLSERGSEGERDGAWFAGQDRRPIRRAIGALA